jgi:CRISPR-associated protein Csx3
MNSKTSVLPAVVIGGPPHSGKSVLAYSLTTALRRRNVPHYVLRAYPDGEGDWANQADPALVRAIRVKGVGTPEWVRRITRDIAARPLPLLVDPGGKPTLWQEAIFRECTHGILLCPDDASRQAWRARFNANDLVLVADFKSELHGTNRLESEQGPLRGTLAGLERGHTASGPAFEQLVDWLARLFAYSGAELRRLNLQHAPTELVVELERLGVSLEALDADQKWIPTQLPRVLDYLPARQPLALYGRGPNWLYAALALHAYPRALYQFDSRLGWITPPPTRVGAPENHALFHITARTNESAVSLTFTLTDAYLDYSEIDFVPIPRADVSRGLILDGKLPLWLWTALARAYVHVAWLAIYQPQLAHALVVHSRDARVRVGDAAAYAPHA